MPVSKDELADLAEHELVRTIPRLQLAERNGQKECAIKVYKMLVVKRSGLGGFIADIVKGRLMSPGREDEITNVLMARLRENGYTPFKVINRRNGIVRVRVFLPRAAPFSADLS